MTIKTLMRNMTVQPAQKLLLGFDKIIHLVLGGGLDLPKYVK